MVFRSRPSVLLALSFSVFLYVTFVVLFGELICLPRQEQDWCFIDNKEDYPTDYENPDYDSDPCRYFRTPYLLFLTVDECNFLRRLLLSVVLGGAIGYERRSSDRPAGIRTMGLVSLGSCSFTISSIAAFKSSTMGWDASRVSAAIPSGVGFIGAGLIWKGKIGIGDNEVHQVHGLTTAASVWLSAAAGVGAGGAEYFVSTYAVVLVLMVLRFGPKFLSQFDDDESDDEDEESTYGDGEDDYASRTSEMGSSTTGGNVTDISSNIPPPPAPPDDTMDTQEPTQLPAPAKMLKPRIRWSSNDLVGLDSSAKETTSLLPHEKGLKSPSKRYESQVTAISGGILFDGTETAKEKEEHRVQKKKKNIPTYRD